MHLVAVSPQYDRVWQRTFVGTIQILVNRMFIIRTNPFLLIGCFGAALTTIMMLAMSLLFEGEPTGGLLLWGACYSVWILFIGIGLVVSWKERE